MRRHGAGEGNRTLVVSLGSFCSTIELHPRTRRRRAVAFGPHPPRLSAECHMSDVIVNVHEVDPCTWSDNPGVAVAGEDGRDRRAVLEHRQERTIDEQRRFRTPRDVGGGSLSGAGRRAAADRYPALSASRSSAASPHVKRSRPFSDNRPTVSGSLPVAARSTSPSPANSKQRRIAIGPPPHASSQGLGCAVR